MDAATDKSLCAICQSPLQEGEAVVSCPACHSPYHTECWEENGGCAIYGCELVPKVGMRSGMEIPASFWGRENKPCPACGAEILAAARRCRHCGATFASAQPENAETFRKRAEQVQTAPALRRGVVWMFIFCVLPFTAPIAALFALAWWGSRREEIKALPALYSGLTRLALIVGLGQTVIAAIMGILFAVFRGA
jgi:predicted RNA-binding Zn-ribbon protein involved in translation (DUF1610 family)